MKSSCLYRLPLAILLLACCFAPIAEARPKSNPGYLSLIDHLPSQGSGPAFNGLDERRRGPIFNAAVQQAIRAGKLPPLIVLNKDLSLPATVPSEPKTPPGARLVRVYLTQWSQTRLGGLPDTEILCQFYVELVRDRKTDRKLGPFFARRTFNFTTGDLPVDRWAQYQDTARQAIEDLGAALDADR